METTEHSGALKTENIYITDSEDYHGSKSEDGKPHVK